MAADTFYIVELVDRVTKTALRATKALRGLDRIGMKLAKSFAKTDLIQRKLTKNIRVGATAARGSTRAIEKMSGAYRDLAKNAKNANLATAGGGLGGGRYGRGYGQYGRGGSGGRGNRGGALDRFRDRFRFANSVSAGGRNMRGATGDVVNAFRQPVRRARTFELEQARISTIATHESFGDGSAVRDLILATSQRLGLDAASSSSAFFEIVSADSNNFDKASARFLAAAELSVASANSMKSAGDLITSISNTYGKGPGSNTDISDILFRGVEVGKIKGGLGPFATGLGKVLAPGAALGLGLEDLVSAAAAATQKGVPLSETFTAMSSLLVSFLKPQKESAAFAKKEFGFDLAASTIQNLGLREALRDLVNKIEATGQKPIDVLSKVFGNKRATLGALALAGKDFDFKNYDDRSRLVADFQGATGRAGGRIKATKGFQLQQVEKQFEALQIKLGISILPLLVSLAQTLGPLIKTATEWLDSNKKFIHEWGGLIVAAITGASVLTVLVVGLGAVSTAITAIVGLFALLGAGIGTVLGVIGVGAAVASAPVAAVGAAAVAVGAAGYALSQSDFLREHFPEVAKLVGNADTTPLERSSSGVDVFDMSMLETFNDAEPLELSELNSINASEIARFAARAGAASSELNNGGGIGANVKVEINVDGEGSPEATAQAVRKTFETELTNVFDRHAYGVGAL